ncbi:hypothetical protein OPT61_g2677 [Boeremia exigua]|uniref:Uncharacterized protein n=1 Tax=Boeremia exigua TaxID=749465 RepID=A0ACC2IKW0_9PLEO|nr:hypothetical protein OPT61_g2677 [Boeremia exigua]
MDQTDATAFDRPLRLLTYLTTAIAVPLNITATILSLEHRRDWWSHKRRVSAFCFVFIPLALTVAASSVSLRYMKTQGKTPRALQFKVLDLVSAVAYFGVLMPCWTVELRQFSAVGFGLLTGYLTAPMILNMFIHIYFTANHLQWKKFFSATTTLLGFNQQSACQQCPNCQAQFIPATAQTTTNKGYSLIRGEDYLDVEADPIQYRDSEDFLGEGAERAERAEQPEQAKAAEEDNQKSKDMI